jgi:hypothetical protein
VPLAPGSGGTRSALRDRRGRVAHQEPDSPAPRASAAGSMSAAVEYDGDDFIDIVGSPAPAAVPQRNPQRADRGETTALEALLVDSD